MTDDVEVPTVEVFIDAILAALDLDRSNGELDADSLLAADAGLDSLDHYEVLCTVEDWANCQFDDELLVTWYTFGDVYRCYLNNRDPAEVDRFPWPGTVKPGP